MVNWLSSYQGESTSFEMWILEDTEKHEWSNHIYKLPPRWNDVLGEKILHFVGVTATNEFVMSPFHPFRRECYNKDHVVLIRALIFTLLLCVCDNVFSYPNEYSQLSTMIFIFSRNIPSIILFQSLWSYDCSKLCYLVIL